jgi:hypothetical protein
MRAWHRYIAIFTVVAGLYIGATGVTLQVMDLAALLGNRAATDPTMQAIRVGQFGPPNLRVMRDEDFTAAPLPHDFDYDAALGKATAAAPRILAGAPLSFVEFRVAGHEPVIRIASGRTVHTLVAASGIETRIPFEEKPLPVTLPSTRNTIKSWHSMTVFGWPMVLVDIASGLALCGMIYTGVRLYLELVRGRQRIRRKGLFWQAGGWWRTLHRGVSTVSALFLAIITVSGIYLGANAVHVNVSKALHGGKREGLVADVSAPLAPGPLRAMLATTLGAVHRDDGAGPPRVLRLRMFAGMPQGVVITGAAQARQIIYDARSGMPTRLTEQHYPDTDMMLGWHAGQIAKRIHRGDIFGLTGRWIALLTGLSLAWLSLSGVVLYAEMWLRRRKTGRGELFWK